MRGPKDGDIFKYAYRGKFFYGRNIRYCTQIYNIIDEGLQTAETLLDKDIAFTLFISMAEFRKDSFVRIGKMETLDGISVPPLYRYDEFRNIYKLVYPGVDKKQIVSKDECIGLFPAFIFYVGGFNILLDGYFFSEQPIRWFLNGPLRKEFNIYKYYKEYDGKKEEHEYSIDELLDDV